jgi:hypothetical protein
VTYYPLVQFVDSVDVSATVRLDLQTDAVSVEDGFSLGSASMGGDPGGIGVEYGFRQISLPVLVAGDKGEALAVLSKLSVELLRETNWLRFQLTAGAAPEWYKTYRSPPSAISFDEVMVSGSSSGVTADDGSSDMWRIAVTLDADPFGWGSRVDAVVEAVVSNDPAATVNPMSFQTPVILGDAPCSPIIWWGTTLVDQPFLLASGPAPPHTGQAEVGLLGADTTVQANDPAFSGVGSNYTRTTFATTPGMVNRLGLGAPSAPGLWRALARVRQNTATDVVALQLGPVWSRGAAPVVTLASVSTFQIVDLGVYQMPPNVGTDHVGGGPTATGVANFGNWLGAQRVSGAGTLDIDYVVYVPADRSTQFLTANPSADGLFNVLDGEQDAVYGVVGGATPFDPAAALWDPYMTLEGGSLPKLPAGEASVVYWVRMRPGAAVNATTTLSMSYYPKFLNLAT